jgi:hypothetical protein
VCRGGRPRERGIEAQKAPYTGPDRLGPGFEPPLTGVSWVGLAALGVHSTSGTTPLCARARVLGFGGISYQAFLEAASYLASLVRPGSYPVSRFVPPLRLVALSPHPPGTEVDLDRKSTINRS